MSQTNKYSTLLRNSAIAHHELHSYKKQCTTIVLNNSVDDYELRVLHKLINHHFPELVTDYRISDGGMNGMTLIAPIEDIKAALELVIDLNDKVKLKYGERIQCIIDNCKIGGTLKLVPSFFH